MKQKKLSDSLKDILVRQQRNEITEYHVYHSLSKQQKDKGNKEVLREIAEQELTHYNFWKTYTGKAIGPDKLKVFIYTLLTRAFGLTFGVKLMEMGEEMAQKTYRKVSIEIPEAKKILEDEEAHEEKLLDLINEELLEYVGSIVLGLNDALIELTGALAGLTLAFQKSELVAVAGGITGIAASFSMAASEYLSSKTEGKKDPIKAAVYTGIAYILTVILLISPYFFIGNVYGALAATLTLAVLIILTFTFYTSVSKKLPFKRRFFEMAGLSLGIAALSFLVGYFIRVFFKIEL